MEVDLSGMKPGERTFDLTANQISLPDKLQPVEIVPSQIHLTFDKKVTKTVPVQPRVIGTFASGFRIASIEANPDAVTIAGPSKSIAAVENALTDAIDVSGLTDRTTVSRHAYVSDPLVQVANPNPVRITIIMERAPARTSPAEPQ
jgi:YbbR domain-containing protein